MESMWVRMEVGWRGKRAGGNGEEAVKGVIDQRQAKDW